MRQIARYASVLVLTLASVFVLPAAPTLAEWESANVTAVNIKKVCRDGIRFDAAVRDGAGPAGDYFNWAVVTDPPPAESPVPSDSVVIRAKFQIPKLTNPKNVDLPGGGKLTVSHLRSTDMRFYHSLTVGHTVALNVEDFGDGSGHSQAQVGNCKLF